MFDKNKSYLKEVGFSKTETEAINPEDALICVFSEFYNHPVNDVGIKYFKLFHSEDLSASFKEFVAEIDYINTNRYENQ